MSTNAQLEQVIALSYASTTLEATHVHVILATISMLTTIPAMVSMLKKVLYIITGTIHISHNKTVPKVKKVVYSSGREWRFKKKASD